MTINNVTYSGRFMPGCVGFTMVVVVGAGNFIFVFVLDLKHLVSCQPLSGELNYYLKLI